MLNIERMLYKLEGRKVVAITDLHEWGTWWMQQNRHVGDDTLFGVRVSTVFLGLDHNYWGSQPLLFETILFGGPYDGWMARYTSYDAAERSHMAAARAVRILCSKSRSSLHRRRIAIDCKLTGFY